MTISLGERLKDKLSVNTALNIPILAWWSKQHLNNLYCIFLREVEEIRRSLYIDDLISSDKTVTDAQNLRQTYQSIFREGKFELRKWHSNVPSLEQPTAQEGRAEKHLNSLESENQTYTKDQLGVKGGDTNWLGMPWN